MSNGDPTIYNHFSDGDIGIASCVERYIYSRSTAVRSLIHVFQYPRDESQQLELQHGMSFPLTSTFIQG